MRIIFPFNPLNEKQADEPYQDEFLFLRSNDVSCSLFDFDALERGEFNPTPHLIENELVLYRGWMLNPLSYKKLTAFIQDKNAKPLTTYDQYLTCHHLPNWYESCVEFTAESVFFSNNASLVDNVRALGWDNYFIKDYVKSNSTQRGSIASTPEEVEEIVQLIQTYRGEIEGGVAVRRVEQYIDDSEVRFFVLNGTAYSPDSYIPDIVLTIANLIDAPFFSVDIVQCTDGSLRLVELGDGQVSDKKSWDASVFGQMLLDNI